MQLSFGIDCICPSCLRRFLLNSVACFSPGAVVVLSGGPSGHLSSRPSALPCFAASFPLLSFDLPESSHKIELFLPIPSKMAIALCSIRLSAVPLPPEVFAHPPPHSLKLTRRFPREQDPQFGDCRRRAARILQLRAKPKKPRKEAGRGRQGR